MPSALRRAKHRSSSAVDLSLDVRIDSDSERQSMDTLLNDADPASPRKANGLSGGEIQEVSGQDASAGSPSLAGLLRYKPFQNVLILYGCTYTPLRLPDNLFSFELRFD